MGGRERREWFERIGDRQAADRWVADRPVARNRATVIRAALGPIVRGRAAATRLTRRPVVFVIALAFLAIVLPACHRARNGPPPSYPGARTISLSQIRFDDGDTFYVDGKPVRVLGIDTPETRSPGVGIFEDQPHGHEASESTRVWIERAKRIELAEDGRGRYGRRLAHVFVDGELLSIRLLRAGLAYEDVSHFGDNGFPDLADRILEEAGRAPKPDFIPPWRWRKKHQKKTRR